MTCTKLSTSLVVAGALASAGLGACGGGDDAPTAATPTAKGASASTSRPAAPYGVYTRRVTARDLARTKALRSEAGPTQELPPSGRYHLVIAKGGGQDVLKVTDPSGFTTDMDMTMRDGRLVTTSYVDAARASFCGPEMPVNSVYRVALAEQALRLAADEDQCADRNSILTGTWTRG